MQRRIKDLILLIIFIFIGTVVCYWQGKDVHWDLANYHYYNIWAFFHHKIGYDIMPCGIQSYFNPFADIPLYLSIKYFNNHPYLVGFFESIWYGLSIFLIYKISALLFTGKYRILYIALSVLIGMSGAITVFETGLCCNDLMISFISLSSIYIYLKGYYLQKDIQPPNYKNITKTLLFSNILFGMAVGLKYTCLIYFIPFFILQIFDLLIRKREINSFRISTLIYPFLGFFIGFSVTGLYWCILIWHKFGNPFFPLMNNFFKSPYALEKCYADFRYLPKNIYQYLFYPFYWFKNPKVVYTSEFFFRDARWIFIYISPIAIFIKNIYLKIKKTELNNSEINIKTLIYLSSLALFSYIFLISTFGIIRYALILELLSGIAAVGAVIYCINNIKLKHIILTIIIMFLLFSTQYIKCEDYDLRTSFSHSNKYVDMANIDLPDNALVFICGGFPSSIIIPFQNPKAKFITIYGNSNEYHFEYSETEIKKIKDLAKTPEYKKYILYSDCIYQTIDWEYISNFLNIKNFKCKESTAKWPYWKYILCEEE